MIVPIAIGAAALWVYYRKTHGLPLLPFGHVPHIAVLTSAGPVLIPASTTVIPVQTVTASAALSLAQAAARTQIGDDGGIHVPRYNPANPNASAAQGALGMFDPYSTMPGSLRDDQYGILRSYSLASRPFETR